jgi:hypothetical protein
MSRSNLIKLNPIWPAWVVSWLSRSLPPSQALCEGPGMKSGLGTIYYYFPDFAYETKNLRQRMSAL